MVSNYIGLSDSRAAIAAARLISERPGQALILCPSSNAAERIATDLSFFSSVPVIALPDITAGTFRYDAKSRTGETALLSALTRLSTGEPLVLVVPAAASVRKLPPPEAFSRHIITGSPGSVIRRDDRIGSLSAMGYVREALAEEEGCFAVRGDIVDVFPPASDWPVRIEFFDDEVDSLRSFDPATQRSIENIMSVMIGPAGLLVRDPKAWDDAVKRIGKAYYEALSGGMPQARADALREKRDYLIECIEEGVNPGYLESFVSYFYEKPVYIKDHFRDLKLVLVDSPSRIAEALALFEKESGDAAAMLLETGGAIAEDLRSLPEASDFESANGLGSPEADVCYCTPFAQSIPYAEHIDEAMDTGALQAPVFAGHMEAFGEELSRLAKEGYEICIACSSDERLANLRDFIERLGLSGRAELRRGRLTAGTVLPGEKKVWFSEQDIFQAAKRSRRRRTKGDPIKAFTDINKGDFVVHEAHGVGRFVGVEKLTVDGGVRDYLKIRYAGEDVLYVPVDQMGLIQKYVGSEGVTPRINKLSGGEWQLTKARAKAAVKDMTEDLIRLSAQRAMVPGHRFGPDSPWQREFEESFPFQETEDQLRCTEEIKLDMESDKAMDRLLCGDVGYGKTEVAARAIFKCIEQGKQAAVLVPTTILANQHYHTLKDRLEAYPFKVEMLSRFRSAAEQEKIIEKVASGEIDLVIGTHRLLSADVRFKDLGLLVVDEEQRFGVEHKDAIKRLKASVDVLTLSATPIPRTLHMSLIGVRDMSVIEQPPEDRYPVQTYVMEQDDLFIASVIRREIGRGGQVYVVYNRVRGIEKIAGRIRELVPEAEVAVGHGQMSEKTLEDVMIGFTSGEADVLVATSIIESGLDIPNVNTMIILDADRFGLSQLYQLRGRVGRSSRMAYAYLMYKKDKALTEIAEKRLRAIREFTEFGSGFRIAMRDLELRGAGNILGVEQSGHMLSIGYELYCKLIDEAVRELKGGEDVSREIESDTDVELAVPAFIPEYYIADELTRLSVYKKIAAVADAAARGELEDELMDRFGDIPAEAENLIDIAMIRNRASAAGVSKVLRQAGKLVLIFEERNALTPRVIADLMDRFSPGVTIYGGVCPRISMSIGKDGPAAAAMSLLESFSAVE